MTTSKQLTWVIVIGYFVLIFLNAFVSCKWSKDITYTLQYLQPVILLVIGSYFTKSGFENLKKISNNINEGGNNNDESANS